MISKRRSPRLLKSTLGVALAASLAFGVVGVASASAATQHWYVGGNKLAEGVPTSVAMKGTTQFFLRWSLAKANYEIRCTSQKGGGTITNPAGGGAGTTGATQFILSGCTFFGGGKNCAVSETIESTVYGGAVEFEGKPAVEFSNGAVFEPPFYGQGCLAKVIVFTGSFTGIANSATSSLEFTKASSAMSVGGEKATLEGTSKLETTSGKAVTVAP
jgi:hypothetical protein